MENGCILCGGCSDICPVECLSIISLKQSADSAEYNNLIYDLQKHDSDILEKHRIVIIKNEDKCIRCGLCAIRCPVGAIVLADIEPVI